MNSIENAVNATYLIVRCGKQRYGIPLKNVVHVIPVQKIRKVPELPAYVLGKTMHEGASVPVIDLRLRMNQEAEPFGDDTCIVILHVQGENAGLLVDSTEDIRELTKKDKETEEVSNSGLILCNYLSEGAKIPVLDVKKAIEQDRGREM